MDRLQLLGHADSIAFLITQGAVICVTVYAGMRQVASLINPRGPAREVVRGEKSWNTFFGFHGLLLLLMFQLVSVAEITAGYRVLLCLFNLLIASYLTLLNGWFRNWAVGWTNKMQKRPER